jgi:hypothetical protein
MAQTTTPNAGANMPQSIAPNLPRYIADDLRDIASTLDRLRTDASPAHSVALDYLLNRMVQHANTLERRVDA